MAGPSSPVRLGEQDRRVRFSNEVLIDNFGDGNYRFHAVGNGFKGQGGFHFRPQHAQVGR